MVKEKGFRIGNIDVTLVAEQPKIASHMIQMQETIARTASLEKDRISIKATTTEGLGFVGKGEGIAAHAVVLVEEI
jgi:2-C-methyl-D-erythritol 2,4-cyclodiphosphate synthase